MKNTLVCLVVAIFYQLGLTQTHTIEMGTGKLVISEVNSVTIQGHDAANIEIALEGNGHDIPERAEGLRMISALGLTDNTGLGLSVSREGEVATVRAVSPHSDQSYIISVPKSISVLYEHSTHEGEDLHIKNTQSEIEVSAQFNSVYLDNVTGPMAVNTIHGSIDADFTNINQSNSITLVAVHDHVDVKVPSDAKATFHLMSHYGTMFTDLDLEVQYDVVSGMEKISSQKVDATFNGGGVDFTIKSNHNDIYLRKK